MSIDGTKKSKWILWVILIVVLATLVFTVFIKDKVMLQNEEGESITGTSGKFNKNREIE